MKKLIGIVVLGLALHLHAQDRPKLVVGIVVDQMRMEYLYRFQNDFSENGFKRIMNKGFVFHNAHYNYVPTYTAPGHATIYTGTTPSVHGIVGNEWFSRKLGKDMYCTDDAAVATVGDGTKAEGEMSPKNLLATTITDELKLGTNFKGKVIGMSLKDRGAILPAGHFADWAFWYSKTGSFISSTFYGNQLPEWVAQFNSEKNYLNYINKGWDLLKPAATYNESDADILVCRTEHEISDELRQKLALFCNVKREAVIQSIDASTIYEVPNLMLAEGLDVVALKKLALPEKAAPDLSQWNDFLHRLKNPKHTVNVGLIGKYVELQDSYKSILEAFIHAGAANETKVNVISIHSEYIDKENVAEKLKGIDGILVAPGFGERGIEGKIEAVRYAREHQLPFFGICLGMQMAVIEYSRTVLGLADANSTEMNPNTTNPVIDLMEAQKTITDKGGTMRLGSWKCDLKEGSLAQQIYGESQIGERHRHRYEYNNNYAAALEKSGLISSGINPDTGLVEIVEIENHPFFIGVQYHPEYKSTVANPQPIFVSFVAAMVKNKK